MASVHTFKFTPLDIDEPQDCAPEDEEFRPESVIRTKLGLKIGPNPSLGIRCLVKKTLYGVPRVMIAQIEPHSVADLQGLKVRDVLVSINGAAVHVNRALETRTLVSDQDELSLKIWRVRNDKGSEVCVSIDADTRGMHVQQVEEGPILIVEATGGAASRGMKKGDILIGVHHIPLPTETNLDHVQKLMESLPRPMNLNLWRPTIQKDWFKPESPNKNQRLAKRRAARELFSSVTEKKMFTAICGWEKAALLGRLSAQDEAAV